MALGDLNIIGDATETLKDLLTDLVVTLDSPATLPTGGDQDSAKINLYLYQVLENPFSKNQPWVTQPTGTQKYPPLALNLYYLLTPYATDPISAHRVLTHAMQKLHDNSNLLDAQLQESLRLSVDHLSIVLCPMELEELTRIWNALQTPYRLSVCYQVRIVLIESQQERVPIRVETKVDVYQQI